MSIGRAFTYWACGLLGLVGCWACDNKAQAPEDRLLARVFNRELRISNLEGMFPEGANAEDSLLIIQAFTQRWAREELLLFEAEKNVPKDLNIDKLVRDYRSSLIRNNYEELLVDQLLDSIVSKSELQAFYEDNKEQYELETPIMRCFFIKVKVPVRKQDSLLHYWGKPRDGNLQRLERYCKKYAAVHRLSDSTWYRIDEIAQAMPKGTISADNISSKREFRQTDGKFIYYFRLLELRNRKEIAPLGYIEGQARKFILHTRKIKLLEQKREELYEQAMKKGNLKLFPE
jgi:hypothetical protein